MLLNMELPQRRSHAVILIAAAFRVTASFAEKRLELFERRKAGIQFQKRLACLLSDKRPNVYYEGRQKHLHAAEEKAPYFIES